MQPVDVAFDLVAEKMKIRSRQPTTGSTESSILGTLARVLHEAAGDLRDDHQEELVAVERQQAETARQQEAEARRRAAESEPEVYDPAGRKVGEVNAWLDEHPGDAAQVLAMEAAGEARPGILFGRHGQPSTQS